ncbi:Sulfotransferase domain-containing protein [Formosa sp. Hel1_31_208]|uniref:sulfotransferase family protein n=1 Tax=Formosa sp. Hel1_31_208 TaxID=1798225 RepID=UPI00087BD72B|nr:sulfotransferase [Formosa sp. Hel1_31_208]SDR89531.1 Sulfotransferase domain-containing protein [Formosa sp. Hel1_31_208]
MKVNFLIIGAAKSATTSLSNALSKHPDICFSTLKEPQFFSREDWRNRISDYHNLFEKDAKLYGEGSTNYTKYPLFNANIHDDIYEYNPDMKLIYIMRHPIDRIISQYIHVYNRGYETSTDINNTIVSNPSYVNISRYAMQINPYIERFNRENVLLLFFEDFIDDPQNVLHTVCRFLELDTIEIKAKDINQNKSFNRRVLPYQYDNPKTTWLKLKKIGLIVKNYFNTNFIDYKPQISAATKNYILEQVKADIKTIETLTNRDLSHWLTP